MSNISYVNGKYLSNNDAVISINDRSVYFADAVYEVIGIHNKKILLWDEHLERLNNSLSALSIKLPVSTNVLLILTKQLIKKNRIFEGLLYMHISRGIAPRKHIYKDSILPSLFMTISRVQFNMKKPVSIITSADIRWKRCDIKSVSLLPNILLKNKAHKKSAEECWFFDQEGFITEGTTSNAWIVKDSIIYTTPLSNEVLPGVTRSLVHKIALENNFVVKEKKFKIKDVEEADEAFLTNTSALVLPINKINNVTICNSHNTEKISYKLQKLVLEKLTRGSK